MADVRCVRCGESIPRPTPLGLGLRGVSVCPACHVLVVSEQGEMTGPDERTDDSWGGVGWQ